ncbi:MAG: c-type cytochrome [Acidobacteria bacterium]|nr:c-type cytochrome [Acidobacteriota bacterium]
MKGRARYVVAVSALVAGLTGGAALANAQSHSAAPLAGDQGQQIYQKWCWPCHGPSGPGGSRKAGTEALRNSYKGKLPAVLDERTDLTPSLVRTTVRNGTYFMAPFRKTEISDGDLDTLIAYLTRRRSSP